MRIHLNIFVIGLTLLIAGCGSGTSGQVAQRLASPTPTLQSGHIVRVPVDRSKKTTPLPTLAPGVPTPVLPTVVAVTPTPYVWPASAYQANIYGTVTDARTHRAISGATVSLAGGQKTAKSDSQGRYTIKFPVGGAVSVEVSKSGYVAVPGVGMLTPGKSTRVNFSLQRQSAKSKGQEPPAFPVIIGHPH